MKQYSIWSNYRFAYGPLWRKKKKIVFCTLAEAVLSVLVPIAGTAITAAIVGSLKPGVRMGKLAVMILAVFLGYSVLNMLKVYFEARGNPQYIEVRTELFLLDLIRKDLTISEEQSEDADIRRLKEKAGFCIYSNYDGIEGFFHDNSDLLKNVLGLVVYSLLIGGMNWKILLMLTGMSAASAAAGHWVTCYSRKIRDGLAQESMTMNYINRIVDDVPGGKDIRLFGLEKWLIGKYDKAIHNMRRISFGKDIREYGSNILDIVLNALRDFVCYLYLIIMLAQGMEISRFVFFLGIIGGFSNWLGKVSKSIVAVKRDSDMIGDLRIYLDLDTGTEGTEKESMDRQNSAEIVFDHVSYRYGGAKEDTLKDISFRLAAGEKLALVGINGAGKTTIVKLMSGLYFPTQGTVYVNGISTKELDRSGYFAKQAAVFQESFLTSYSIGENVALEETYDAERVWKSLSQAGLYEKVRGLDRQLDTHLGKDIQEDGIALSGGEIQKLLLARVLYRNAALIMLDEPTAALDALAETEVYEKYKALLKHKTVLFISHRLASTRFCDRILVLSEGRIREEGTHAELMRAQGEYYHMFRVQSKYYQQEGSDF